MALVSEQLPNLMNGVSQQAVSMRMRSQGEEQINGLSSIVLGNTKRPPMEHIARLGDNTIDGSNVHLINRDVSERYTVVLQDESIRVFDLDGNEKTVTYPDGTEYLSTGNPTADLRAITVADYTFIVNRNVVVQEGSEFSPSPNHWAQVFLQALTYSLESTVEINGTAYAKFTEETSNYYSQNGINLKKQRYIENLAATFGNTDNGTTELPSNDWWTPTTQGLIHIERADGGDFDMKVTDSEGNNNVVKIGETMPTFTDLPTVGKDGVITKIVADTQGTGEGYYLKFNVNTDGEIFGKGYWEESVGPGVKLGMDNSTMPHVLVRQPDGSFEFRQAQWGGRVAGDEETAPWPSFVGRKINDVYFDRRRLCLLADDNVVMSRARSFFDFFPETVQTVLDDGPIDVSASQQSVSILNHAVPYNNRILLFSDQTQFTIDDRDLLASQPPSVTPVTGYESQSNAEPVSSGKTVFFVAERGSYSAIMEMFIVGETEALLDAQNVTEHVPAYIPSNVFNMTASETSDILLALSKDAPNTVFTYKYHWSGSEKIQSSWSQWKLGDDATIYSADFVKDEAYMLVGYPEGLYLTKLLVTDNVVKDGEDFEFRLDRRIDESMVTSITYDEVLDRTIYRIPYRANSDNLTVATRRGDGSGSKPPGVALTITDTNEVSGFATDILVRGDVTGQPVFIGVDYTHLYEFSEQVLKTSSGRGVATVAAGRLQLLHYHVFYDDTGYFRTEVEAQGRDPQVSEFTGIVIGAENNVIGETSLSSGSFRFPIRAKANKVSIRLINDSFLPSTFTGAEWEARYTRRTSRA